MTRILHISDLHFGVYSRAEQVAAIEQMIADGHFDVVAVSGDLTQRARRREFARASAFLARAERVAHTVAVPGNHDIAWWRAPMHLGVSSLIHRKWRVHLGRPVEPVLRIPGVTIVGINTAHGISRHTLTTRPRDLSVIGDLRDAQLARAAGTFATCAPGDYRIVVMHHNPVAGELSGRFGLKHSAYVLGEFARMGVDVVLCGHDHQEAVHHVDLTPRGVIVSIAGTLTTRSRGGRPGSVNVLTLAERSVEVATHVWDAGRQAFVHGPTEAFSRL